MLVYGILSWIMGIFNLINILLIYSAYKFTIFIYTNFIRKEFDLKSRYGGWAFVTGATDGLGRAFCDELASRGFNIILVSRNLEKLKKVEQEIKDKYKVETFAIEFDFDKKTSLEDYKYSFGNLPYEIGILVNNVGMNKVSHSFDILSGEDVRTFINVNVIPQATLTKLFINNLKNRKMRSAVIDLSSYATFAALPYNAMYCATKSYNDFLSRSLSNEYDTIDFLSVKPLYAETPLSKTKADGIFVINATQCIKGILHDLGHTNYTVGHWIHQIQAFWLSLIPNRLVINSIKKGLVKRHLNSGKKE